MGNVVLLINQITLSVNPQMLFKPYVKSHSGYLTTAGTLHVQE